MVMMNRTEAIIVTAAIALATLPGFEAKVEQYVKGHRTEIQMAVNQLEFKPAIPFAAPDAEPKTVLAYDQALVVTENAAAQVRSRGALREHMIAAREQHAAELAAARVRSEMATLKMTIPAQVQMQLADLQPQLAGLRMIAQRNPRGFRTYRLKGKACPEPPAAPAAPNVEIPSVSSTY